VWGKIGSSLGSQQTIGSGGIKRVFSKKNLRVRSEAEEMKESGMEKRMKKEVAVHLQEPKVVSKRGPPWVEARTGSGTAVKGQSASRSAGIGMRVKYIYISNLGPRTPFWGIRGIETLRRAPHPAWS